MIRWLLFEALRMIVTLLVVSIVTFAALDSTGQHDWYGTLAPGRTFGLSAEESLARQSARFIASAQDDATTRTQRDVALLASPASARAARDRLLSRGTVVIPTALTNIDRLPPAVQRETYEILSLISPTLTGGDAAPRAPEQARPWWDNFRVLHEIDLRDAYARRHVQRLVDHESPNAREQLARLGTLALPALFEALDAELDTGSARRLCNLASDLTHTEHRISATASAEQTRAVVEGWRSWWFVHRLDYVRMGETQRSIARVSGARYGLWLARAFDGRTGPAKHTGRSVLAELRERLPRSTVIAGLGGLVAVALVVAFGGGEALRRRPFGTKIVDLVAALFPGLIAFALGFVALCSVCAGRGSTVDFLRAVLSEWPSLLAGVALLTAPTVLFLRRDKARLVLHAVRSEADSWASESKSPKPAQLVRHGARVGVASLLAPAALNALVILALTLLVEPVAGVRGMGELTLRAIAHYDGVWLQFALLSVIPVAVGTRWARTALLWALGGKRAVLNAEDAKRTENQPPVERDTVAV
jgi:ABC-type dipeptide/oligopeptide/nickel transport system permease component